MNANGSSNCPPVNQQMDTSFEAILYVLHLGTQGGAEVTTVNPQQHTLGVAGEFVALESDVY
jgi:hypothetical protein